MQLKAQLLSLHLPHKFAQTVQIQVVNLTGRLLYYSKNLYCATQNLQQGRRLDIVGKGKILRILQIKVFHMYEV